MKQVFKHIPLFVFLILVSRSFSQQLTQTIRGTVVETSLQTPVAGATVVAGDKSAITDEKGNFKITGLNIGSYTLKVTHVSFNDIQLDNIVINSGKETVITIPVVMKLRSENEVVVKGNNRKNKPLNELSVVSSRAFTVEETRRYAAAVNDPLRMATAFPGVANTSDGQNNISIRGNAPTGLLWKMEGVDIPNPNHFGMAGGAGGGVSILSAQLLSNSDFITGAFAAEYGNALSGVFDLHLRRGNNEKNEYTAEAGVLGLNVAAEGPIAAFYKGSYLVNYRYSTLSLLSKMGLDIGSGNTDFQDLSYNIYFPTARMGTFSLFGFNGLSSQTEDKETDPSKWENDGDRYSGKFKSNTIMNGLTHTISLNDKMNLKSALSYSHTLQRYDEMYAETDKTFTNSYRDNNVTKKWVLNSTLNYKIDNQQLLRAGIILSATGYDYYQRSRENITEPVTEKINVKGNTQTMQAFAQWRYRLSENITFNSGFHYLHLFLNNTSSVDPRASVKWDIDGKNAISLGYGLHSQVQGMGVYFTKESNNKNLDFTKAHHFVLSYSKLLQKNLRFKAEVYYQHLFDVPVSDSDTSSFSTVNIEGGYIAKGLTNQGKGRNYGIELSLERYFAGNYYYMVNTSLYQSKYTALDGIERNTAFNGGHTLNFVAGKDFVSQNNRKTFGVNIKTVYSGGLRSTPINMDASQANGYTVYIEKEAFSLQNPAYFRTDIKLSMKWNKKRATSTFSLDIQNLTNRQNIYTRIYDAFTGDMRNIYQAGLIPVLNYKIEF